MSVLIKGSLASIANKDGKKLFHPQAVFHDRHFRDIGYHYIVDQKGTIHRGRPFNEMGADAKGHNATSMGICYIGGLDSQGKPPDTSR